MKKRLLVFVIVASLVMLGLGIYLCNDDSTGCQVTEKEVAAKAAELYGQPDPHAFLTKAEVPPIDLSHPLRMAVGGLGLADNDKNQQLGDLVTVELTGAPGFDLVERQSLSAILRELNLNWSGFVRAKDAVRAGKLLKADWFLLGTEAKINGTNSIVARVVDARTGVMRDAGVFVADKPLPQLSADLVSFLRETRASAAHPKLRVFLAVGAFEDLSVNNRQTDFPNQLRGFLTAAYRGSSVTLLEREYAETLLQEVRLDLAGLTDTTNAPEPMQSAYWLADWHYQSYETTNYEVEVVLNLNRMFGRWSKETFRGVPDDRLFQKIKQAIDAKINQDTSTVVISRVSEARAQMSAGKELADLGGMFYESKLIYAEGYRTSNHRTDEESIRAFETVLLLEPTNREAKIDLAACLRFSTINRTDEARNLYRELLEEPVQDKWAAAAQQALVQSFSWSDPAEKRRWFSAAAQHNTNSALDEFYRQNADTALRDATISARSEHSTELAQHRLVERVRSCKQFLDGKGGTLYRGYGLHEFQEAFPDETSAAKAMADFLPTLEKSVPELAPHVAAEVLTFQVDTNSPAMSEFEKTLDWCVAHPKEVFQPGHYWPESAGSAYQWLSVHQQYSLAVKTMEAWRTAAGSAGLGSEEQVALGFAYLCAERWEAALKIFEGFSKMPVLMTTDGPWGNGWQPVLTSKEADYCRKKLGLSIVQDSKEFNFGKACFCWRTPASFATGDDGVWIAVGGQLFHLDYELKTNLIIKLPIDNKVPITTLDLGIAKIWIGTDGAGLLEFDKSTRQCRRLTVADGLTMDEIRSTLLVGDTLWLGYGSGIGFFNLSTRQFTSFTRSMTNGTEALKYTGGNAYVESVNEPPRRAVQALAVGTGGEIWFLTPELPVRRFQSKGQIWEGFPQIGLGVSLASDADHLYVGNSVSFQGGGGRAGELGVHIFSFRDGQCRSFKTVDGIPSQTVSAIALDGHNLWVGGMGYIALLDIEQNEIRKLAYVQTRSVDKIQIAGGYVWAQFDWHLYRAPLSMLQ